MRNEAALSKKKIGQYRRLKLGRRHPLEPDECRLGLAGGELQPRERRQRAIVARVDLEESFIGRASGSNIARRLSLTRNAQQILFGIH